MSNPPTNAPLQSTWTPSKYATPKEEIWALRYYRKRDADPMGRRIARGGGDPRIAREDVSMSDVNRRYEELERSEPGKKLIAEVIAEEEAIETTKQELLQGQTEIMGAGT
ncbi:hypothetical protein M407DRAFT_21666 [Tulasnella calospora MUT 4182]|uniref:Uncharacterized protein n=1 Tax=Tulasnella calospora MUT 4182 TaxID=1051891 RepID=A0A0C3QPJ4_9AGAM|nr:hypothetical protein M407DRAFT_21666 [Tulasnella calospora MUT 4182]